MAHEQAFSEADLLLDARELLRSEGTVINEIGYRLKASFEWAHFD